MRDKAGNKKHVLWFPEFFVNIDQLDTTVAIRKRDLVEVSNAAASTSDERETRTITAPWIKDTGTGRTVPAAKATMEELARKLTAYFRTTEASLLLDTLGLIERLDLDAADRPKTHATIAAFSTLAVNLP